MKRPKNPCHALSTGTGVVSNFADLLETAPVRAVSQVVKVPVHFHTKQVFFEESPEQHTKKKTYTQHLTHLASFYLAQSFPFLISWCPFVALVCYIISLLCCFLLPRCSFSTSSSLNSSVSHFFNFYLLIEFYVQTSANPLNAMGMR